MRDKKETGLHPEVRNVLTAFKLTKTEREELDKQVEKEGVSLSRYVRHVVMNDVRGKK